MYAVLTTDVNSDEPGPVLAKIVSGTFQGGTLIGSLSNQGEKVLLTFNTLSMPGIPRSISINSGSVRSQRVRVFQVIPIIIIWCAMAHYLHPLLCKVIRKRYNIRTTSD